MSLEEAAARTRAIVLVRGVVQGVGFRPFVSELARRMHLGGSVRNETGGVFIDVEGAGVDVDRFIEALRREAPPLARIDDVERTVGAPTGASSFRIERSAESTATPIITPDAATCAECLSELFDPENRRFGHAFANCTHCGPRLTIVRSAPYDRERTTMASFAMCARCEAEYEDVHDRRFHAQPIACPQCGPRLELVRGDGSRVAGGSPIETAGAALRAGELVAVKGIGGYHLACNAADRRAVFALRVAKARDEKPFALLVATVEEAERLCELSLEERRLLTSAARPIVLLRKRAGEDSIAPRQSRLGVMLAYTALHHLLARSAGVPLVMTSGNITDEPIAFDDEDALARLGPLVSLILRYNRPIHTRCDDSIAHVVDGAPSVLRRSRGYAPLPLPLRSLARPTLALGAQGKSVFALGAAGTAFLSHHLGELDHFEAERSFREAIEHYCALFRIAPERVVHDLHPDYASTRLALELEARGLERVAVQHHEAHVASCLAEHGHFAPAIGVAFDGSGYGRDGAIWGGEFFVGSLEEGLRRMAHLRYVPMPGGDRVAREPWRIAESYLLDAGIDGNANVQRIARNPRLAPLTSSVGRLFDAVAALAGLRTHCSYEAQAAIELQSLAEECAHAEPYPFVLAANASGGLELDVRPMVRAIVDEPRESRRIARRFHETVARMIDVTCMRLREWTGVGHVALSGGVFANALLTELAVGRLRDHGFVVFLQRAVPSNDGGLALGQLALSVGRS